MCRELTNGLISVMVILMLNIGWLKKKYVRMADMLLRVSRKMVLGGGRGKVEQFLVSADEVAVSVHSECRLASVFRPKSLSDP